MHDVIFAGRQFLALPDRAMFWVERRALLVADLHLEKASWFARSGQMLPPFDSRATLERLTVLADRVNAQEIWALGDSFHDDDGLERLGSADVALVDRLAVNRRLIWIAGNHDPDSHLPGERCEEAAFDDLVLRHEALADEQRYEISGHFHPKHRVHTNVRSVSRPCFAANARKIILPAFGALTGGLDMHNAALARMLGDQREAWIATATGLHCYPVTIPTRHSGAAIDRRNRNL